MRRRPLLFVAAALVAMAVVVVVGLFAFRDLTADAVRRVVVPRLEAVTHREVSIAGAFDLVPSATPTLAAEGLVVANAPWGSRPTMLEAERVEVEVQLLPLLLRRDVVIDRLALVGADILLERGPEGQVNWQFDPAAPELAQAERRFLLREVSIEDSRLTWHDATSDRSETVAIEQLVWHADSAAENIVLTGAGQFDEQPFTLAGALGPVHTLRQGDEPYPIRLELTLADLEVQIGGQLSPGREAQLDVRVAGESLARIADLLGAQLPELGAFELEGRLTGPLDELALTDLSGRIGDDAALVIEVMDGRIAGILDGRGIQLAVRATGPGVAALGNLVGRKLPELGSYQLEGKLTGSIDDLALTDLTGTIGDDAGLQIVIIEASIADILEGQGIQLAVRAAGPSVAALGDLVGRELPELGAFLVEGELTGSIDDLALNDLSGAIDSEGVANIRITDGRIEDVLAREGIRVQFTAAGDELARVAAALGVELAPFGPYRFEGTLAGSFDRLALQIASGTAGDEATRIDLAGAIADVPQRSGLDLAVSIEGESLAALSPIARIDLPASERYRITGNVSGSIADLRIENLEVQLADSTLRGSLAFHLRDAAPPLIEGDLVAERLDLDRLVELAGRARGDGPAPPDAAPSEDDRGQLFPTAALPVDMLNEIEADLTLRAEEVLLDEVVFADVRLDLVLRDGRLGMQDLVAHVENGGTVAGDVAVEAAAGAAEVTVRLSAGNIDVGQLLSDFGATEQVVGEVDIDLNIDSTGRSLDELIGQLEGSAALAAEEGRIEDDQLHRLVADLDILRVLPPFRRSDEGVRVNCLVIEFDLEEGVAETGAMLDTQRMTLLGEGTVDLGEETLDLLLRPVPKTQRLSTLAVPLQIEGTFAEPAVRPRTGAAAVQAVRGLLGGLLVPLNQLSGLFGQETVDACIEAMRQAQERREQQARRRE